MGKRGFKVNYIRKYENSCVYNQTISTTLNDKQIVNINNLIDKTKQDNICLPFLDGHSTFYLSHIHRGVNYLNITTKKFIIYMLGETNNRRVLDRNTILIIK